MAQHAGLIFTFKRTDYTPDQYTTNAKEDNINILYFTGCWSLVAKIECLARQLGLKQKNNRYIVDYNFLTELLHLLRSERRQIVEITCDGIYTTHSMNNYRTIIQESIVNLENLLFYINERIAASEMFLKLSDSCYFESERAMWIDMCKSWGNEKPNNFEIIFWID